MPMASSGWEQITEFTQKLFGFFTKQEVKTPLSFFFRVVTAAVILWAVTLYLPIPDHLKYWFIKFSAAALGSLVLVVSCFAIFKPRNLVYGESAHRAERKLEYGTDKRIIDEKELIELPKASDEKLLQGGTKS
jgi:hypothetical protein